MKIVEPLLIFFFTRNIATQTRSFCAKKNPERRRNKSEKNISVKFCQFNLTILNCLWGFLRSLSRTTIVYSVTCRCTMFSVKQRRKNAYFVSFILYFLLLEWCLVQFILCCWCFYFISCFFFSFLLQNQENWSLFCAHGWFFVIFPTTIKKK